MEKKEKIRRRCRAVIMELEIDQLNNMEEKRWFLKNEIAAILPEIERCNSEISEQLHDYIHSFLERHVNILQQSKIEDRRKLANKIQCKQIEHQNMFRSDGLPLD